MIRDLRGSISCGLKVFRPANDSEAVLRREGVAAFPGSFILEITLSLTDLAAAPSYGDDAELSDLCRVRVFALQCILLGEMAVMLRKFLSRGWISGLDTAEK